jgi:hypothetical protein
MNDDDETRPDWSEWRLIPQVELWQAVALSLDCEPNKLQFDGTRDGAPGLDESVHGETIAREFAKRLRVLLANLTGGHFSRGAFNTESPHRHQILLAEFAAWVRDIAGWNMPVALLALVGEAVVPVRPGSSSAVEEPSRGVPALAWTDARKAEARAMRDRLKADGARDYAAQTAAHYGITPKRLREVLSESRATAKVASPFPTGTFRGRP